MVPYRDGVQRGTAVAGGHLLPRWVLCLSPPRQGEHWHLEESGIMEELTKKNNHEEQ